MDLSKVILKPTEDIELRVPTPEELGILASKVFEKENYDHVVKFTGISAGTNTSEKYLENKLVPKLAGIKKGTELLLVILYKGQLAGRVSCHDIDYEYRKTELGYFLFEEFTDRGIMSSCITSLEEFLFSILDINRIELSIDPDNKPSRALAERLGYKHEGTLRESYFNFYLKEFRDDMVFGKLKSEAKQR